MRGKPFTKNDSRINKRGRPKSFDQLRALAQMVANEAIDTPAGRMTRVEAALRELIVTDSKLFLEIAFGKVPQPKDDISTEPLRIKIEHVRSDIPLRIIDYRKGLDGGLGDVNEN